MGFDSLVACRCVEAHLGTSVPTELRLHPEGEAAQGRHRSDIGRAAQRSCEVRHLRFPPREASFPAARKPGAAPRLGKRFGRGPSTAANGCAASPLWGSRPPLSASPSRSNTWKMSRPWGRARLESGAQRELWGSRPPSSSNTRPWGRAAYPLCSDPEVPGGPFLDGRRRALCGPPTFSGDRPTGRTRERHSRDVGSIPSHRTHSPARCTPTCLEIMRVASRRGPGCRVASGSRAPTFQRP